MPRQRRQPRREVVTPVPPPPRTRRTRRQDGLIETDDPTPQVPVIQALPDPVPRHSQQSVPQPQITLTSDQLETVADRVTQRVVVQLTEREAASNDLQTIPIYDRNGSAGWENHQYPPVVIQTELMQTANLDVENIAVSPVRPNVLNLYIKDYPDRETEKLLFEGFSSGFRIKFNGPREEYVCSNLKSLDKHEQEAIDVVMKEVKLGRVAGPFTLKPLPNLRLSPVGLIPKKDGTWRLIYHLSYPEGTSVNDFIDHKYCSVNYTSFDTATEMLAKLGKGVLASRLDIKSAFRLLPIHPSDFELLGYKIKGLYFVDKCLPFGCSISCPLFEKLATFLEWELKRRSRRDNVVHYLDDFLVTGRAASNDCQYLMNCYSEMCSELGIPLAEENTIGPTTSLPFPGLQIDTNQMMIKIQEEKLRSLKIALNDLLHKKKTTLNDLQSLTGLLNFCSRVIPGARAFNRRFYDSMAGVNKQYHRIRVNLEMKEDIKVWLTFLEFFNGCSYYDLTSWEQNVDKQLFTDSAGCAHLGCGAIFRNQWSFLSWPTEWRSKEIMKDITFLELVPIP